MAARHKFPSESEIKAKATRVSKATWGGAKVHTRLFPKASDMAMHVGYGVFLTRCPICGEVFLDPGASTRPAPYADHLWDEHDIYDGYDKPIFPLEA